MPAAPFVVHIAGKPEPDHQQRCVPCGVVLLDNSAWDEGRVAVPVGTEDQGPAWWPGGALVATDKVPGGRGGITYQVEGGRTFQADEMACT